MKYYKAFRVANGELYSAFEMGRRRLHYKVRGTKVDPKPDKYCEGLMILCDIEKAKRYTKASIKNTGGQYFILREVKPLSPISLDKYMTGFAEAFTNSLYVGRKIFQGGNHEQERTKTP